MKSRGRIAVIGAGLTGVSSAAHAVGHGFDVVIYEKQDKVGACTGYARCFSPIFTLRTYVALFSQQYFRRRMEYRK
jgi:phytoene dehydrogenase-like protein